MDSLGLVHIVAASIQIGVVAMLMFCALLAKKARQASEPVPVLLSVGTPTTGVDAPQGITPPLLAPVRVGVS